MLMRYFSLLFSTLLAFTGQAQVMLPSYQGTMYHHIPPVVPTVTTTAVTALTAGSASSGGDVTSTGGATVTAKGVCWSTSTPPTIANSVTDDGTGLGTYTSAPVLTPGTTYYLCAYATNSAGTGYGTVVTFTTPTVAVGASFEGGYVFYILASSDQGYSSTSQHGLIVAATDLASVPWDNGTGNAVTTNSNIGYGNANTIAIVAAMGAGTYAASSCANLVLNGYSDWYLPSYDEVQWMGYNSSTLGSAVGFTQFSGNYWTSFNNASATTAYEWALPGAVPNTKTQGTSCLVRPVRSF